MNRRGFTLIELMITITILGTLTVLTARSISQAIKSKEKLDDQLDDVSRMRDAMRLLERDINMALHYRDLERELNDLIKAKNQTATPTPSAGTPSGAPSGAPTGAPTGTPPAAAANTNLNMGVYDPFALNRELPRRDPVTYFMGGEDSINFVTSNNARMIRNSQQADFVEVGYSLKDCKSLRTDGNSSKCLWRRSTPYVDDDVTRGGDEVVLLENVTEFKLRYIGKGKQDFVSDWKSDSSGDAATKYNFPDAVEISLTIEKKLKSKSKKYSMNYLVPIHFPNNDTSSANGGASGSQSGGGLTR